MDINTLKNIVEITDRQSTAHESWKVEADAIRTSVNEIIDELEAKNPDLKKIEIERKILVKNCCKFLVLMEEEKFKKDTSQDIEDEPKLIM
ncbi:hypothetical protein DIE66_00550 [Mycoplasmopsis arginini]|uniref:hypothetical protein n=1 Tax=Mycoplasmopsis arginini TaxID=2094 RepID=UPI000D605424|nr:hypothetical protein [Mycoplasmopsis arginini]PWC09114.1 hypothetical protein DIE66_00550 [Mycoplasmopsis arginini]